MKVASPILYQAKYGMVLRFCDFYTNKEAFQTTLQTTQLSTQEKFNASNSAAKSTKKIEIRKKI